MNVMNLPQMLRDFQGDNEKKLRQLLATKRERFFWTEKKYEAALRRAVDISANDTVIAVDEIDYSGTIDMRELLQQLEEGAGQKIAIIVAGYYESLRNILHSRNYRENVDFCDGRFLIPCRDGVKPWRDYDMIEPL